jgi:hypothetical protein
MKQVLSRYEPIKGKPGLSLVYFYLIPVCQKVIPGSLNNQPASRTG